MSTADIVANIIAGIALLIAIVSFLYAWKTNTKKYELTEQYRNNLLQWYQETTIILIQLKLLIESGSLVEPQKYDLLSRLSSQIELGRFYFPNIDKGDFFGKEKPTAYQGYRHIALEFLVFSYNIFIRVDAVQYLQHATELQRHFTSYIYELLQPKAFNRSICKYTTVILDKDIVLEEYLRKDPKNFIFYS